jgi:hypothetical protein
MALSSTVMQCSASRAILGTAASGQNERPASRDFANCAVLLDHFNRSIAFSTSSSLKDMCVPPLVSELHSQNAVGLNFR